MTTRMLRALVAAGILTAATGCEKSAPPVSPSETSTFTAQLSPADTVPLVTNAEAFGSGNATVNITVNRDTAGAITSASASVQASVTGLPPATTMTSAHIHRGAPGTSGLIVLDITLSAGDFALSAGAGGFTKTNLSVSAALAQEILSSPSGFYLDVHSLLNPEGQARGQLVRP
jgi:hypothetical protein